MQAEEVIAEGPRPAVETDRLEPIVLRVFHVLPIAMGSTFDQRGRVQEA